MIESLLVSVLIVSASILLGLKVLRLLRIARRDPFSQLALAFALGFGAFGNFYMVLGFLQLYKPILLWAVPAVVLAGGYPFYRDLFSCVGEGSWAAGKMMREQPIWSAAGLGFLFVYLCRGLLPPTGIDELMYHLSVPQLYLDHGGFFRIFFNPQANLVMLTEMNFLPILATGNATGCKFLGFIIGLALTLSIGILSRDFFGFRTAIPAMVLFLSLTNTIANFSTCDVDFTMALFAVLGFTALFGSGEKRPWALGVLLLGFCVQSKGIGFFAVASVLITGLMTRTSQWKAWLACLGSVLFGIPWLAKSLAYANPNTASMIAQTGLVPASSADSVSVLERVFGFCFDFLTKAAAAPWSFSLFPDLHRMDTIGPLFLVLIPLLFFERTKRTGAGPFLLFAGVYVLCVSFFELTAWGPASIRYSTPILAVLCPVAVLAWTHGSRLYRSVRILTGLVISLTVVVNFVIAAKRYRHEIAAVLTAQPQREYLSKNLSEFSALDYANRNLSPTDTILTTTCFGTYYLRIPYVCAFKNYASRDALVSGLKQLGVTYYLENDVLAQGPNVPAAEYLQPIFENGVVRLSKVIYP